MEQLTLEQKAAGYSLDCFVNNPQVSIKEAFKAGAEWQKEQCAQLLTLLKGIAEWPGNISDEVLQAATGPNDAALRGGLICDMRDIALEAIRRFEPDYIPFP